MPVDHTKNIVEVSGLSISFDGHKVLRDLTMNIHAGDYVGVIGPNGGGKTTFIKLMVGLLMPAAGTVRLFGQPIETFRDWYKIGYVAQKATNFDMAFPATVGDVVSMGRISRRGLFRSLGKKDVEIVDWAIEEVGLKNKKCALIGSLSGGQQQLAFIARALAQEPELIILDEPTAGVDVRSQEQFYGLLNRLNRKNGITLVLVSHDIDVVISEVTEVACINESLVYHGKPKEFTSGNYLKKLYGKDMKFIIHAH